MEHLPDLNDFRLSGLHAGPHGPSFLSDVAQPSPAGECNSPLAMLAAIESAIRLLGRTLYRRGMPHYIVNSLSGACVFGESACIEVLVPDARSAFDCLKTSGMKADPMRSLSVKDRTGSVSIRLLESCAASDSFRGRL